MTLLVDKESTTRCWIRYVATQTNLYRTAISCLVIQFLVDSDFLWVVVLEIGQNDTCLCHTHANINLKFSALYNVMKRFFMRLSRDYQKYVNKTPAYKELYDQLLFTYKKMLAEKQEFLDPKSKKFCQMTKHIKKSFIVQPQFIKKLH